MLEYAAGMRAMRTLRGLISAHGSLAKECNREAQATLTDSNRTFYRQRLEQAGLRMRLLLERLVTAFHAAVHWRELPAASRAPHASLTRFQTLTSLRLRGERERSIGIVAHTAAEFERDFRGALWRGFCGSDFRLRGCLGAVRWWTLLRSLPRLFATRAGRAIRDDVLGREPQRLAEFIAGAFDAYGREQFRGFLSYPADDLNFDIGRQFALPRLLFQMRCGLAPGFEPEAGHATRLRFCAAGSHHAVRGRG